MVPPSRGEGDFCELGESQKSAGIFETFLKSGCRANYQAKWAAPAQILLLIPRRRASPIKDWAIRPRASHLTISPFLNSIIIVVISVKFERGAPFYSWEIFATARFHQAKWANALFASAIRCVSSFFFTAFPSFFMASKSSSANFAAIGFPVFFRAASKSQR